MADDRMKNDDLQRNMGTGSEGQKWDEGQGQKTPGRNPQEGQQGGQQGGQQTGGQKGTQQKEPRSLGVDEEFDRGSAGQGGMGRGGQNR